MSRYPRNPHPRAHVVYQPTDPRDVAEPRAPRAWLDGWIASYRVTLRHPIDPNRRQPLITLND